MHFQTSTACRRRLARRTILKLSLIALIPAAHGPAAWRPLQAQEPGEVVELKGNEVTAERLIEILAPSGGTRGVGLAATPALPPHCKVYHERLTRGIGIKPVAAIPTVPIHFAFNSAAVTPEEAPTLDAIGKALTSERLAGSCFSIEGHTDGVGSHAFNDRLSRRRAEAVVHYLTDKFSLEPQRLVAVGRGKRAPMAENVTPEGRQRNRRVQIVNLGSGEGET